MSLNSNPIKPLLVSLHAVESSYFSLLQRLGEREEQEQQESTGSCSCSTSKNEIENRGGTQGAWSWA